MFDEVMRLIFFFFFLLLIFSSGKTYAQLQEYFCGSVSLNAHSQIYGTKKDHYGNTYFYGKNGVNPFILKYDKNCTHTIIINDKDKLGGNSETQYHCDSAFVSDISFGKDGEIFSTGVAHVKRLDNNGYSTRVFVNKIVTQDTLWSKVVHMCARWQQRLERKGVFAIFHTGKKGKKEKEKLEF